jgi:transposase
MQYHANAALTLSQRKTIQHLHREGVSVTELARRFGVHRRTIERWIERSDLADRSSAPHTHGKRIVSDAYRQAVLDLRRAHPTYGPLRIAHELRERFVTANTATIWRILHAAGLSQRAPKKSDHDVHSQ